MMWYIRCRVDDGSDACHCIDSLERIISGIDGGEMWNGRTLEVHTWRSGRMASAIRWPEKRFNNCWTSSLLPESDV